MNLQSLVKSVFYRLGYSIKRLTPPPGAAGAGPGGPADPAGLMRLLHRVDPYEGFAWGEYPDDVHGWGSRSPAFADLIREERPSLIVEVGTWKGGSAIEMARILHEEKIPGKILCIDTWLGAVEFWTDQDDPDRYRSLGLKHGYPTVYYQFLANVCRHGAKDRIIPFPQTSSTAALWLRRMGIRAPMIYIDGSHEEEDVYADLINYRECTSPGGVIFGDDWTWDGVRLAVQRFARENGLAVTHVADKWVLRMPR